MEFNQLESFINVVNLKSFSKAAEKMFLTQPAITNNIQNLEKELGTVLLNRKNKKITVTEAGEILYRYANDLINMRDTARYKINKFKGKVEGNLEISASSIPEQYVLPYIIKEFADVFPNITITINHKDSKQVVEDVLKGYTNYGIVGAKYESKFLEYINFYEDNLIAIVPNNKKYTWNSYEQLDINFLMKEKIILREEGSGTRLIIENALKNKGIDLDSLNVISSIESNETIKKMVELGLGISFISEMAVKNEIELGLIKPYIIKGLDLKRNFYFVYYKNRYLSPIAEEFKDFLVNWNFDNRD